MKYLLASLIAAGRMGGVAVAKSQEKNSAANQEFTSTVTGDQDNNKAGKG